MKEYMDEKNKKSCKKSYEKFTQTLSNTNNNSKSTQTDRIQINVAFTQTNINKEKTSNNDIDSNNNIFDKTTISAIEFEPIENMDTEDEFLTYTKPKASKSTISVVNQAEQFKHKKKNNDDVYDKLVRTLRVEQDEDIPRTKNPNTDIYRNKNFQYKSDNQALNDFFQNNLENYITKVKPNMNKIGLSKTSTKGLFYY
jgi:hypothetical protein